ncbi:MAG: hypothetical protein RL065_1831 [Bacteroidota bacterium]
MATRIFYNQQWNDSTNFQMDSLNSGFYFGESFFETIKAEGNTIPFWQLHKERIQETISYLSIHLSSHWQHELIFEVITNELNRLSFKESKIRITFFRQSLSETEFTFLVEISELMANPNSSLSLTIYYDNKKSVGKLSNFKTGNRWLYKVAADYAASTNFTDAIILNTNGYVAEATQSNLFILKNGLLLTPPLTDGMINGVCRKFIVQNFSVIEKSIGINELMNADEIFLTNAVRWIQSVNKLEEKMLSTEQTNNFAENFKKHLTA